MVRIGSRIRITSDNANYARYMNKTWTVNHIATNREEHPGYDEGLGGKLISCEGLPFSLYEWEFEEVSSGRVRMPRTPKPQLWGIASNNRGWHIVEIYSGRMKFIGIARARRANYFDNAVREAITRNRKLGIDGYLSLLGINLSYDQVARRIALSEYTVNPLSSNLFIPAAAMEHRRK